MPHITAANAREMGAKGNIARWSRPKIEPELPRLPIVPPDTRANELVRVQERLDQINEAMDETSDAKELDALTRAYDRIFRAWMVLSGTPGSGQRKPVETRSRRTVQSSQGYHAPEEPVALPDPVPIVQEVPVVPVVPEPEQL